MLKKILITLAILIAVAAGLIAMQPGEMRVTRTAKISAPPAVVFAQVNDFHNWQAWSPWAKLDPAAKNTFEGISSGEGAIFKWSGNSEVGEGVMTIADSHPNDHIQIKLDFTRPMVAHDLVDFTFKPAGEQTEVTWTMAGQKNFICKGMCLVIDMDKMVGGQFEQGLAAMDAAAQAAAKK